MALTTSIVLCTYNGARFLPAQWESLLAQTLLPDEIVVRDDASTDATPGLLRRLVAEARARGVTVRDAVNPRNLGYVANFECALREASGDVLFLCDQDDVWHPDKLATQLAEFERRDALWLLCGNARRVDPRGTDLGLTLFDVLRVNRKELRNIHAGRGFEALLRRSLATGATVALRQGLLKDALPFPEGWVHDEWLAIMAAAMDGFDCIDKSLVDYRQHDSNQIGMRDRGVADKWRDLRNPRADLISALIARDERLLRRLQRMNNNVSAVHLARVGEKLAHLRTRLAIGGAPWSRIAPILGESLGGRYRDYGSGWRSALRDFARRH